MMRGRLLAPPDQPRTRSDSSASRHWLRRFHDTTHLTSLFVTHDQEEAFEVADRVVIIDQGAIQQIGTPDEVSASPANSFVEEFLDLDGTVPA